MTDLSPLWVKKVTPIDDDFIPYVAPNNYQYKPALVPTYPQDKPYTYDTPRTARAVTLGVATNKAQSQNTRSVKASKKNTDLPMGPDIPYTDYQQSKSTSRQMGPDIPYRDYGLGSYGIKGAMSKSKKPLAMGPDIRYRDYERSINDKTRVSPLPMGPDIRHRETKYKAPSDRYNVSSSLPMGPDIPFRDYRNTSKTKVNTGKRTIKPLKPTRKATNKDKSNVKIKQDDTTYKGNYWKNGVTAAGVAAAATVPTHSNDDWKRPYELAGEAAVLSWIRTKEKNKRQGNSYHGNPYNRFEVEVINPTGARESIRRTYDFHGADF